MPFGIQLASAFFYCYAAVGLVWGFSYWYLIGQPHISSPLVGFYLFVGILYGYSPVMGAEDQVQVTSGCGNVRRQPSINAKVVACLKNGTTVTIDTIPPRYVESHI